MKIIFIFLIFSFLLPTRLISYFDYNSCENENMFFVNYIKLKQINVSSLYCDFWKNISFDILNWNKKNIWKIIYFDKKTKFISKPTLKQKNDYIKRLKVDLKLIKNDSKTKNKMYNLYIKDFRDYENNLSNFLKPGIFSKDEIKLINSEIEKSPYKVFQNTYSEKLLMDGKIISREEWWADETYAHKEVYEKKCPSWNCWSSKNSTKISQIRQNYINNFYEIDNKNKIVKTFTNWRDPINYYPVERIVIHHTAWWYKENKEQGLAYMKAVHSYHALNLGWADVGYHYLIDWEWNIYEWKAWGKYSLWSHVVWHNYWSVWISLMSDWYYSEKMLNSLKKLIVYLWEEYDLDLTKKQNVRNPSLTAYENWWVLVAHKELDTWKPKDPEINMDSFRSEVASIINTKKALIKK